MGTLWLFRIQIHPVKAQQFSLLFSTAYQVEQKIKRIYIYIYIYTRSLHGLEISKPQNY